MTMQKTRGTPEIREVDGGFHRHGGTQKMDGL